MDKKTIGTIVGILIVIASVLVGLSTYLPTADQSNCVIALLTKFFSVGTVMFVVALIRNVAGFAIEYIRSEYSEAFVDGKLYETIVYYVGLVALIGSIVPEPYNAIGMLIMTIADLILQTVKKLWNK